MRAGRTLSSGAFRFALFIALVFAFGSAALLATVAHAIDAYTADAVSDGLASESAILVLEDREGGRSELIRAIGRHERAVREEDFRYLLTGPDGRRLAGALPATAARLGWSRFALARHGTSQDMQLVVLGAGLRDGARLFVAADASDLSDLRRRLLWFTGGFGTAIAVLAMLGGLVTGSLFVRRLDGMNAAIERIMGGALGERLPRIGMGPEFDQLSANLNAMLGRIDLLVQGLRQVSTDLAHDLRTPLARLRHRLEAMAGEDRATPAAIDGAIAQVDEVLAIFAALLRIGTLESGASRAHLAPLSLSDLAVAVVDAFSPEAEDAGRPIAAAIRPGIVVEGDRELIAQALNNLIENALRHTPPGTRIAVSLDGDGQRISLAVTDDGPGIPADRRAQVLRRFYRLDRSRNTPGSGLGLSLVAAVADIHGGTVELLDARPGLRIELILPRLPPPPSVR